MALSPRHRAVAIGIMFAAGLAGIGSASELDVSEFQLGDGWLPSSDSFWVSNTEIGVIAQKGGANGVSYGLLTLAQDGSSELALPLADQGHCITPDRRFLLRTGSRSAPEAVEWRVDRTTTPLESPQVITLCKSQLAKANRDNEDRFGRQNVLATDGVRFAGLLAAGEDTSEIVLYDAQDVLGRWKVAGDLWRDPVEAVARPDGSFLFYADVGAGRQAELKAQFGYQGIPTFVISADGDFEIRDLPWPGWKKVGNYKIAESRVGWLLAATSRRNDAIDGLYHLGPDGWRQVRNTDVLPETLEISPDGCRVLWHERADAASAGGPRQIRSATLCRTDD